MIRKRRPKAVADALIANHEIAAVRRRGEGIDYLAPAATNDSEVGRALNRRVELVKDK